MAMNDNKSKPETENTIEVTENSVKIALEYLQIFLRYFASGLPYFIILYIINERSVNEYLALFKNNSALIILLIAGIGLLNYAIHIAFFDRQFFKISYFFFRRKNEIPDELLSDIKKWKNDFLKKTSLKEKLKVSDIYFSLSSQTYLRAIKEEKKIKYLQSHFDKRLSLLSFLYCCIYPAIFLPAIFFINNKLNILKDLANPGYNLLYIIFALGFITFLITLHFDCKIVKREFWIVKHFHQKV